MLGGQTFLSIPKSNRLMDRRECLSSCGEKYGLGRHPLRRKLFQQVHRTEHVALGVVKLHDAHVHQPHGHVAAGFIGPRRHAAVVDEDIFVDVPRRGEIYFITLECANDKFADVARKNVAHSGLSNVEVRHGDVLSALRDAGPGGANIGGPFDVVTLDLQEAAEAARGAYDVLRPGGFLATYSPFFEQAAAARKAVELAGFAEYNTIIVGEQELEVGKRGTRPSTRVGHTGFITIARK